METDNKMRGGGNYSGHDALVANKYGDEVSRTGWNSRRKRTGKGFVAPSGAHKNGNIAKADESKVRFLSSAIPECP